MASGYRDLEVWQLAIELAKLCYEKTHQFPKEEAFGLTSQIRRAASSVPANIAEGYARRHRKQYLRHLSIARGVLMRLESHLQLSQQVGMLAESDLNKLLGLSFQVSEAIDRLKRALNNTLD